MGANFYLKRKLSSVKKHELIDNLTQDNYEKCEEILNDIKPIHIGKRSDGWKFLWNANNFEYFKPNKNSLYDFLKSGIIEDEYNNIFTFEEFWNVELKGFLDKGLDLKEYYDNEISKNMIYQYRIPEFQRMEYSKQHKVEVNERGEFFIDDLRFTTCTEFS